MAKGTTETSPASHVPYLKMITEAISVLKYSSGSSQPSIAKFIEDKYDNALPPNFSKLLSVELKKLVESKKLSKNRNSYKLPPKDEINRRSRTRRLSQVKTPEALNVKKDVVKVKPDAIEDRKKKKVGKKLKHLSEVTTPAAMKKPKKK